MSPEGGSDVAGTGASEQGDDEVTAGGEGLRDGAAAHLGTIFIEGDVADVMEAVLNAPMPPGQGEERFGVSVFVGEAGDVVANIDLGGDDLLAPDDQAVTFDATDLAKMGPRRPVRAGAANVGILLGVSQRPEHPDLTTPMSYLWRGVDEPTERSPTLDELTLEPGRWRRHPCWQTGRLALSRHPGGKEPLQHRRAAQVGWHRPGRGSRHGR